MSVSATACRSCITLNGRLSQKKEIIKLLSEQCRLTEENAQRVLEQFKELNGQLRAKDFEIRQLTKEVEKLKASNATLQRQLFGVKSEANKPTLGEAKGSANFVTTVVSKRPRGKQPGTKGFGRFVRETIPVEDRVHAFEKQPVCANCGAIYAPFPGAEVSEEIHRESTIVRLRHFRTKAKRTCKCAGVPAIVTAPGPDKLPQSMFSLELIVFLLIAKYHFQMPVNRLRKQLELEGLSVSQGMITEVFKRIAKLVEPLKGRLEKAVSEAHRWQMDETRWKVFAEEEGKEGSNWWLWVTVTDQVTLFTLDPSRSAEVPKRLLKDSQPGVLSSDRYSVYHSLGEKVRNAWCWAHVRRDFVRLQDGYPELRPIAERWIEYIGKLYQQNKARLSCEAESESFLEEEASLRKTIQTMEQEYQAALEDEKLHQATKKVFASMESHWSGLTLFVDLPSVPMDNNASERALRPPVMARKASYGSGSKWSGEFAATMFSILQTLEKNKADPRLFLLEYLQACGKNRGHPPEDLTPFLPWDNQKQKTADLSLTS